VTLTVMNTTDHCGAIYKCMDIVASNQEFREGLLKYNRNCHFSPTTTSKNT